jgi:DNA polymerase-3 subunit delta
MTPAQVRAQIASGTTHPIYLLESDDAPSRYDLAQAFLALVDEGLHAFNTAAFHAREAGNAGDRDQMLSAILGAARTLPMMAPRRIILVHDAEFLLTPRKAKDEEPPPADAPAGKRKARATTPAEDFEAYVAAPEPLTTLVLDAPSLDRGRRITKLLLQKAMVVDCGSLETAADAARWITARLEQDEMTMDAPAMRALVEATGLHLSRIRAEIDKLVLYAGGNAAITAGDVRDVVIPAEDAEGKWALSDAIQTGQTANAVRELGALLDEGVPAPLVLGQIRAAVGRLRPDQRARQALRRVLETDLAVKSSRGEPRYVLETLVVEVCAGAPCTPAGPTRRSWA